MAKNFSWSFSKLKNFETCPRRHYEIDILGRFKEEEKADSPLAWGMEVHDALAGVLKGTKVLPPTMREYDRWVKRVLSGPGTLYTEQKYAITESLESTNWRSNTAWYRGVGDFVRVDGPVAMVGDWKTGKVKVEEYRPQLHLMAACVFAHFSDVKLVRSEFIWLNEDTNTTDMFSRATIAEHWMELFPRINALKVAYQKSDFPPKPSGLCKSYCPVTTCPFHGKGSR